LTEEEIKQLALLIVAKTTADNPVEIAAEQVYQTYIKSIAYLERKNPRSIYEERGEKR